MDKINSLSRMLERLRQRVNEPSRTEAGQRVARGTPQAGDAAPARSLPALKAIVRKRLAAIAEDDPRREARITRVFVESVIAWEFGESIMNDPEYEELVRHVAAELQADEKTRDRVVGVLEELAL